MMMMNPLKRQARRDNDAGSASHDSRLIEQLKDVFRLVCHTVRCLCVFVCVNSGAKVINVNPNPNATHNSSSISLYSSIYCLQLLNLIDEHRFRHSCS